MSIDAFVCVSEVRKERRVSMVNGQEGGGQVKVDNHKTSKHAAAIEEGEGTRN